MDYFAELDVLGVLARLITAIPDAIGPTLMGLAVTLCALVLVDRLLDRGSNDRAGL